MQRQKLNASFIVNTSAKNTKTGLVHDVQASVLLPHKLFADIWVHHSETFHEVFGTANVSSFWSQVNKDDVRLAVHPDVPGTPEECQWCIPGWVHGDGVEYHDRDSLMTWSWGSLLALQKSSLMSSFLYAAWPKLASSKRTWHALMQVFVWSLKTLAEGKWPAVEYDGSPWAPGSEDARKAGTQLAGGWKLTIIALLGDQEHFSNTLGMPHWQNNSFCWLCDCCKKGPAKKKFDYFATDNDWVFKTMEEELLSPTSRHPLFNLGLTVFNICLDVLHAWDQGIWLHLAASFLTEIIYVENTPSASLTRVWQQIQAYYGALNTKVRLTNLTLSMLTGGKKRRKDGQC